MTHSDIEKGISRTNRPNILFRKNVIARIKSKNKKKKTSNAHLTVEHFIIVIEINNVCGRYVVLDKFN